MRWPWEPHRERQAEADAAVVDSAQAHAEVRTWWAPVSRLSDTLNRVREENHIEQRVTAALEGRR